MFLEKLTSFLPFLSNPGDQLRTVGKAILYGGLILALVFLVLDFALARTVLYPAVVQGGERYNARSYLTPVLIGKVMIMQKRTKPASWRLVVATPIGQQTLPVTSSQWDLAKKGQHLTVRGQEGYFTGWQYTGQFVTQAEAQ